MKFLLLNQTFYPDVASTAQYLSELALALLERGHQVTVITSRRAYDHPDKLFDKTETWRGVQIIRLGGTGFGKGAKWKRAADFASFLVLCAVRLIILPRQDAIVALTSPPLISFLGAWFALLRRSRFLYWVMDFNPDEAIAAGWLRPHSLLARILDSMSRFSLRRATKIIALDRFMRDRIVAKGISPHKVVILPPWSHDSEVFFNATGRERFRNAHGLADRFVVMYSGNHSPCHPLDTLLEAARKLSDQPEIVFLFVGGGSEWRRVKDLTVASRSVPSPGGEGQGKGGLSSPRSNIRCLPYQPLSELSGSLSAADLHVVVMGDPFVGLVHPCKIYNILAVAAPSLYIGPRPSHLCEIIDQLNGQYTCAAAHHGDVDTVVAHIKRIRDQSAKHRRQVPANLLSNFSKEAIIPKFINELESNL